VEWLIRALIDEGLTAWITRYIEEIAKGNYGASFSWARFTNLFGNLTSYWPPLTTDIMRIWGHSSQLSTGDSHSAFICRHAGVSAASMKHAHLCSDAKTGEFMVQEHSIQADPSHPLFIANSAVFHKLYTPESLENLPAAMTGWQNKGQYVPTYGAYLVSTQSLEPPYWKFGEKPAPPKRSILLPFDTTSIVSTGPQSAETLLSYRKNPHLVVAEDYKNPVLIKFCALKERGLSSALKSCLAIDGGIELFEFLDGDFKKAAKHWFYNSIRRATPEGREYLWAMLGDDAVSIVDWLILLKPELVSDTPTQEFRDWLVAKMGLSEEHLAAVNP